jgi:hypothetical protein
MLCTAFSGGVLADQIFNWHRFTHRVWTAVAIVVVGAIYILLGFLPYIDNFGHLFGMATGFFLTTCLLRTFPVGCCVGSETCLSRSGMPSMYSNSGPNFDTPSPQPRLPIQSDHGVATYPCAVLISLDI